MHILRCIPLLFKRTAMRFSLSAQFRASCARIKQCCPPKPKQATTPFQERGHLYSIPQRAKDRAVCRGTRNPLDSATRNPFDSATRNPFESATRNPFDSAVRQLRLRVSTFGWLRHWYLTEVACAAICLRLLCDARYRHSAFSYICLPACHPISISRALSHAARSRYPVLPALYKPCYAP
eukprot:775896-Rhodomonas_salina.4